MTPTIRVKRVYDQACASDGCRIFVDRLWARGVSRNDAAIDLWPQKLLPSTALRKWYHADRSRHVEFELRYRAELETHSSEMTVLLDALRAHSVVTLVTATRDLTKGHAAVLASVLEAKLNARDAR